MTTHASRPTQSSCPRCQSPIATYQIHLHSTFAMCSSENCPFPFDSPEFDQLLYVGHQDAESMSTGSHARKSGNRVDCSAERGGSPVDVDNPLPSAQSRANAQVVLATSGAGSPLTLPQSKPQPPTHSVKDAGLGLEDGHSASLTEAHSSVANGPLVSHPPASNDSRMDGVATAASPQSVLSLPLGLDALSSTLPSVTPPIDLDTMWPEGSLNLAWASTSMDWSSPLTLSPAAALQPASQPASLVTPAADVMATPVINMDDLFKDLDVLLPTTTPLGVAPIDLSMLDSGTAGGLSCQH
ncbi:hypothetical protein H4R35_006981 [Dimargaris xerosporica]|nr:hypothetical protein H4R35_006981 [Dimargaris xerosporica]